MKVAKHHTTRLEYAITLKIKILNIAYYNLILFLNYN
jgi:hypothetical protein